MLQNYNKSIIVDIECCKIDITTKQVLTNLTLKIKRKKLVTDQPCISTKNYKKPN